MPVQVSYPGVYIEEIPSGVRTITGDSCYDSVRYFADPAVLNVGYIEIAGPIESQPLRIERSRSAAAAR